MGKQIMEQQRHQKSQIKSEVQKALLARGEHLNKQQQRQHQQENMTAKKRSK